MTKPREVPPSVGRVLSLLRDPPSVPDVSAGYVDLLGPRTAGRRSLAQTLMVSRLIPPVYERYWRPLIGQLAKGLVGPTMAGELVIALDYLALTPGDVVLDIACGPGNFTRRFGEVVGDDGLAIGLDASRSMLDRAVADTRARNVGYVRADAARLPFADSSVDAVCCFAALHLFSQPLRALDQMIRVLRPGGRIALMAAYARGPAVVRTAADVLAATVGIRLFSAEGLTGALATRGITRIRHQVSGMVQFVGGTKPRVPA